MLDGVGPAKLLEGHGVGSTDVDLDDDDVAAGAASPVVASSPAAPTPLVPPPKGKGGGKGGGKLSAKQVKLLKEGEKIDKAKQKEVSPQKPSTVSEKCPGLQLKKFGARVVSA